MHTEAALSHCVWTSQTHILFMHASAHTLIHTVGWKLQLCISVLNLGCWWRCFAPILSPETLRLATASFYFEYQRLTEAHFEVQWTWMGCVYLCVCSVCVSTHRLCVRVHTRYALSMDFSAVRRTQLFCFPQLGFLKYLRTVRSHIVETNSWSQQWFFFTLYFVVFPLIFLLL